MFKKPFVTSTSPTPCRSSAARKLIEEIALEFSLPKELVKSLLKPGLLNVAAHTHLRESFTLYMDSEGTPLWFRMGKTKGGEARRDLVPTMYFLDLLPAAELESMLPSLVTSEQACASLVNGSNLFIAGIAPASIAALPARFRKNDLVGIRAGAEMQLYGVGWSNGSKEGLQSRQEGEAVITVNPHSLSRYSSAALRRVCHRFT